MLTDVDFGGARRINTGGRFFLYYSATNPTGLDERLKVYGNGRYIGTLSPGDFIEEMPVDVNDWYIEPITPTMVGRVFIGDAKLRSNRLTGNVRVIDEAVAKTLAGNQFGVYVRKLATAGVFSLAGVLAGTKTVVIKRMSVSSSAAGIVTFYSGTGAMTSGPGLGAIFNKQLRGAVAAAQAHAGFSALQAPTAIELPGVLGQGFFYVPTALPLQEYPLTTPIVVAPGQVFAVQGPALNTEVGMLLDLEEVG